MNSAVAGLSLEIKQKAIAGVREFYPDLAEEFEQRLMKSNDIPVGVLKDLVLDRERDKRIRMRP